MTTVTDVLQCSHCQTEIPADKRLLRRSASGLDVFCGKSCSVKFRCGPITCEVHGPQDQSFNRVCILCRKMKVHGPITCEVHGYQEVSFAGKCSKCHNKNIRASVVCDVHGEQAGFHGKCSKCLHGPMVCEIHGPQETSIQLRCLKCHHSKTHGPMVCEIHGLQEQSFNGKCTACSLSKLHGSMVCEIHGPQGYSFSHRCPECANGSIICEIHGHQEKSLLGACYKCNNGPIICETHGSQEKSISGLCYKCHHSEMICKIHGHQQASFAGACILCHNADLNKALWLYESPECSIHLEEVKLVLRSGQYQCWSCVKEAFTVKSDLTLENPCAFWQPTYRTRTGYSEGQILMEEELKELGVKWFVYLKGFIKDDVWIPLVVGKTGSKLVNYRTDITFRYDGDNPGRAFLRESALLWDTSKILVIPCDSEADALEYEKALGAELELFYS